MCLNCDNISQNTHHEVELQKKGRPTLIIGGACFNNFRSSINRIRRELFHEYEQNLKSLWTTGAKC